MANGRAAAGDHGRGRWHRRQPTRVGAFPPHRGPASARRSQGRQAVRLRSSANAFTRGGCRKSDLSLPLHIPIRGHADLPGISDRAVYAAFLATFWSSDFFLFIVAAPPTFHARACLAVSALASPPPGRSWASRPSWASRCCGLLLPRPARAAARAWECVGGRCRWALLGSSAWTSVS